MTLEKLRQITKPIHGLGHVWVKLSDLYNCPDEDAKVMAFIYPKTEGLFSESICLMFHFDDKNDKPIFIKYA